MVILKVFRFFREAGAMGHVFILSNGKSQDKGLAWSGLLGFKSTVAVVPCGPQFVDFSVETLTADNLSATVSGTITIEFVTGQAVKSFDFTVNEKGSYFFNYSSNLNTIITNMITGPIKDTAVESKLDSISTKRDKFENSLESLFKEKEIELQKLGINISNINVSSIEIDDEELSEAIAAEQVEGIKQTADNARHKRQLEAAKNTRVVKQYEAQTALELAKSDADIIKQKNANKLKEAEADGDAIKFKLEGSKNSTNEQVLAAAFLKMAEKGVGSLTITPDLLNALKEK